MKKISTLLLFFFLLYAGVFGQQRNAEKAGEIASAFLSSKSQLKNSKADSKQLTLVYTSTSSDANLRSENQNANFYVFNVESNSGFVIVSGDERTNDILGYSNENYFDKNNLPDNFKYWLSFYEEEISQLRSSGLEVIYQNNTRQTRSTPVAPLLKNIRWDQGAPYNALSPEYAAGENSATGCVATAMAQIMKYHEWPVKGIGSHSYITIDGLNISLSADFSQTTYDWTNMTPMYTSSSTLAQKDAVATLMYHCGVAVEMDYGPSSGAYDLDVAPAFVNYFNYDKGIKIIHRQDNPKQEWTNTIKNEIAAGRPVYLGGVSQEVGHAFVCDGYDANELFHINWGWSGMSNGYFALSALTPDTQGIGGSNSGYNFSQSAIIGIQKPAGTENSILNFKGGITGISSSVVNFNTNFAVSYSIYNYGIEGFAPIMNLGLYDDEGNLVTTLHGGAGFQDEVGPGYGNSNIVISTCKIPSTTAPGTYKIFVNYKGAGDTDWKIVPEYLGGYILVRVADKAYFEFLGPELELQSLSTLDKLYQGQTASFEAVVKNTGTLDLLSMMALKLVSKTNSSVTYLACDPASIGQGETATLNFNDAITVAPGEYSLYLVYDINNKQYRVAPNYDKNFDVIGNAIDVTVLAEPVLSEYVLELVSGSFPDKDNVTYNNFNFTFTIKNTGDYYNDLLFIAYNDPAGVLTETLGFRPYDYINIILESGETKTYSFKSCPPIDPGNYRVGLLRYKLDKSGYAWVEGNVFPFTLKEEDGSLVGIDKNEGETAVSVYPNPTVDKLYLDATDIVSNLFVYDLAGKQVMQASPNRNGKIQIDVENLAKGTYILRWITNEGVESSKFIKN